MPEDIQTQAPVTDDQELAKVLASMSDDKAVAPPPAMAPQADQAAPAVDPTAPVAEEDIPPIPATLPQADIAAPIAPAPVPEVASQAAIGVSPVVPAAPGDLENIKQQALQQLRPIVGKLELPAEEKFDALLLVIRSSDDQSLVQAAYQAAEGITDEAKKAQALLDIVKEIEYFATQGK